LTNNPEIRSKAALLATQARSNRPFYYHEHIGYNYQMNGFAAELGIAQFDSLENRVIKKRNIFQKYYEELSDYPFIQFQLEHKDVYSNRWLTTLLLNEPSVALELKKYMMQNDIEIRHLWKPMHQQPVFKDVPKYLNGNSEWLFDHGIALPSGTNLNHLQHDRILKAIHGFLKLTLKS